MKKLKKILIYGIYLSISVTVFAFFCNFWIIKSTTSKMYSDVKKLPSNDVALVLGTVKKLKNGYENLYFTSRIDAAYTLYKNGKIKHLILSGDNSRNGYNEPEDMRNALIAKGIPELAITLDYAGFRTLDSVVRCNEVFQQNKVTIVSQAFHNARAVFLAEKNGLDVVAFNAKAVNSLSKNKEIVREFLARCKAVLDLYFFRTKPKFLGEKVEIKI